MSTQKAANAAPKALRRLIPPLLTRERIARALELNALTYSDPFTQGRDGRQSPPYRVAIKDNIATSEFLTTCASNILRNYTSPFNADVVTRNERSGLKPHIAAKTNLDEFGMGSHSMNSCFGPVQSQHTEGHPPRTAGGSSGGSAVAVQTNAVDIGIGTDTGGSVRLPAAYTGTIGFKGSYGWTSRFGVVPYANSLDTVGVIASRFEALEKEIAALEQDQPEENDPTSHATPLKRWCLDQRVEQYLADTNTKRPLRIGVPLEYNIEELDPAIRHAWQTTLERFQDLGCTIIPVSLPTTKHALSAYYVLAAAEASSNLSKYDGIRYGTLTPSSDPETSSSGPLYSSTRASGFGAEVKRRILLGSYTLSSTAIDNYFLQAQRVRRLVQRDFDRIFAQPNPLHDAEQFDLSEMDESINLENKKGPAQVDVLICPTAPTLPPTLAELEKQSPAEKYMNDVFTVPASLAGLPAISVPVPIAESGEGEVAFAGMQIIGQYWADKLVVNVAKVMLEQQEADAENMKLAAGAKTVCLEDVAPREKKLMFKPYHV